MSSDHPRARVTVGDACAHCTGRIRLVIEGGHIAADPASTVVFWGGG